VFWVGVGEAVAVGVAVGFWLVFVMGCTLGLAAAEAEG